jgi:hypothetical protein
MSIFNRIAVEFVPEGITAEEARSQRAKDKANRRMSGGNKLIGFGAIFVLAVMVAGLSLWWQSGSKARADGAHRNPQLPATVVAVAELRPTPTETPTPAASPTPTATATPTSTPTQHPEKAGKSLLQDFVSPISTPRPDHPDAPTPAPEPTVTPLPSYEVLYTAVWPEGNEGASYHISGWVVEEDGKTPRPVAMELCYQDGCMEYPRPGASDVSTGFYEFLVSPGYWTLRVKDADGIELPLQVYPDGPARYEISFRFNGVRPVSAARSNPWDTRYPTPASGSPGAPTATATAVSGQKNHQIYLPVAFK